MSEIRPEQFIPEKSFGEGGAIKLRGTVIPAHNIRLATFGTGYPYDFCIRFENGIEWNVVEWVSDNISNPNSRIESIMIHIGDFGAEYLDWDHFLAAYKHELLIQRTESGTALAIHMENL